MLSGSTFDLPRNAELSQIQARIELTEKAMLAIHTTLQSTIEKTTYPKDKRSAARKEAYGLLGQILGNQAIIQFNYTNAAEIDNHFKRQESQLDKFYKNVEFSDALLETDKEFFKYLLRLFRALTLTRFFYQQMTADLTQLSREQCEDIRLYIALSADDLTRATASLDRVSEMESTIAEQNSQFDELHAAVTYHLTDHGFVEDGNNTFIALYNRFAEQIQTIKTSLQTLDQQKIALEKKRDSLERNRKEIANKAFNEDEVTQFEQDIEAYNAEIAKYNRALASFANVHAKLLEQSNNQVTNINKLITSYTLLGAELTRAHERKNILLTQLKNAANTALNKMDEQRQKVAVAKAHASVINAPVNLLLNTPGETPKSQCDKLKANGYFTGKQDAEWTALTTLMTTSLQDIGKPVAFPTLNLFDESISKVNQQHSDLMQSLDTHEKTSFSRDTVWAKDFVQSRARMVSGEQANISARLKNHTPFETFNYQRPKRYRKNVAASTQPKQPGFFRRHWKAIVLGTLFGVGLAVAGVFTLGAVPAIVGACAAVGLAVSAAAATGIAVGAAVVGGTVVGVAAGSAVGAIIDVKDRHKNQYRIQLDDNDPDDAPAPAGPAKPAVTPAIAPKSNLVTFPPQSPYQTTTVFAPAKQKEIRLAADDIATRDELRAVTSWAINAGKKPADIASLEAVERTLKEKYDIIIKGNKNAERYIILREEYRNRPEMRARFR